ncbi:hypothetical protein [Sphaerisporangium rubeum]|uniref:Tetratricopeptide (TPR) repeat protein n=1 Tax=Sphaerisporangium rubeum TaxID=321317 RepID=A0A7X0I925_9ACTN|nr:hypothetical protein [Sphaerisporangium rubeum]MBB6470723.1 tetratricopeptide (TPR) repeat protein [Sphaerisporangium rubeum]
MRMVTNTLVESPRDVLHVGGLAPAAAGAEPVVVAVGTRLPVAFSSLRAVLTALTALAPEAVDAVARRRAPEWEWLFPGTFPGAPLLADLAGTPSERRLHAESEQVFRVLDAGAEAVTAALVAVGRPLLLRGVGQADVVSLRALPRIAERLSLSGATGTGLWLTGLDQPAATSARAAAVRHATLTALLDRLGLDATVPEPSTGSAGFADDLPAADVPEHRQLSEVLGEPAGPPERTAASALLAIRSCFFSANHVGGILAAEALLALLDTVPELDCAAVREHFTALDPGDGTPAIGVHVDLAASPEHLRAFARRSIGVVRALVQDIDGARTEFDEAAAVAPDAVSEAQVLLLRALLAVKRAGTLPLGVADIEHGLRRLAEVPSEVSSVEQAWLRNVRALAHVRAKEYPQAMREEKKAVALISKLHSADATHLKINLISNISVLQEMAKKYETASGTWDHFAKISSGWGDSFFKHHTYRAAGLAYRAGRDEEALTGYASAYELARKLDDQLHQQILATEIGGMLLDLGDRERAGEWYALAETAATTLGDPYALALARTGRAVAAGETPGPDVRELAAASLAFRKEAAALIAALDDDDPAAPAAALPRPTTKLNRPFRLIALDLATPA